MHLRTEVNGGCGTVLTKIDRSLRVCSYEDRAEAMDSVILMAESLCCADAHVSLHLTVPEPSAAVRAWAERRPEVVLATKPPDGVSGWDVKPWLMLQELNAGNSEVLWLDTDVIVTRPISALLREFPRDSLIVAEEWNQPEAVDVACLWNLPSARPICPINSCLLRATQAHRPLLQRWLEMTHEPRYRQAQALPFEQRPFHLISDQVLLTALLGSAEFGQVRFDYLRMGRHIAQCAGSSGYRPLHRLLDLYRGLPPIIHCIGRKPWTPRHDQGRIQRLLMDLVTDVSPYVLASKRVARKLGTSPDWVYAHTALGAILRVLTANHPGMAGLPLAVMHTCQRRIAQVIGMAREKARTRRVGASWQRSFDASAEPRLGSPAEQMPAGVSRNPLV